MPRRINRTRPAGDELEGACCIQNRKENHRRATFDDELKALRGTEMEIDSSLKAKLMPFTS